MPPLILVLIGGAVGAGFRYQLGSIALRNLGPNFPWGTWIVNLIGGLLMGILAGVLAKQYSPAQGEPLRLEIVSFLEAVRTRATPVVSGADGRAALQLAPEINAAIGAHAPRAGLRL